MDKVITAILIFTGVIVLIAILTAVPIMFLWNWLMPELFNLPQIDFWQALGISVLSGLLFKNTSTSSNKNS